jgi:hypothetical protein
MKSFVKSFDEVMAVTGPISSFTALEDAEAKGLYDACCEVPHDGVVVEVGCQLGRSSSIISQMAGDIGFHALHIDPYTSQPEWMQQWARMMYKVGGSEAHAFTLACMRTEQAKWLLSRIGLIDMAYIDGGHQAEEVQIDLDLVANNIRSGGLLTAHDYGRDSLPGVWAAINPYVASGWYEVGVFGTLGVWRRK